MYNKNLYHWLSLELFIELSRDSFKYYIADRISSISLIRLVDKLKFSEILFFHVVR